MSARPLTNKRSPILDVWREERLAGAIASRDRIGRVFSWLIAARGDSPTGGGGGGRSNSTADKMASHHVNQADFFAGLSRRSFPNSFRGLC